MASTAAADSTSCEAIECARVKYSPAERIEILFIAEAPSADPTRLFYFEHVQTHDWLYLALMRATYDDACRLEVKKKTTPAKV